jgi:exodeoxyribonuclease-3
MKKAIRTITVIGMLFTVGPAFVAPLHAQTEESREESSVKVMSYNIYRGGTMHGQPLSQTVKVIQEAKADIVGLQEMRSPEGVNTEKLTELLGWNHYGQIFTRYEIVEELQSGVKVKLPSGQGAYIFNLHLPADPYLPYQFLGIKSLWPKNDKPFIPHVKTEAEAIAASKKGPGIKIITDLIKQIRSLSDKDAPVFVVGDFNEPSHLDWTEAAAKAGRHPLKVAYPASKIFLAAGFGDAYRTIYPDEMAKPGFTWTPMEKSNQPRTHHDRIDYIYYKGVKVTDAKIIGENEENADIVISPYPSDHRAVVATFALPNQPNVSILLSTQLERDAGYQLALEELRSVLEAKGYRASTRYLDKGDPLPDGNKIIVGELGQEIETGQFSFNKEAYRISQAKEPAANILKIEGDRRGGMYGLFKLAEQLQLGGKLWEINLELAPEFSMRMYTELGQLYDLPSVGYHLFEEPWVNHERFETEKEELKRLIDQVAKLGFNTFTLMHVNFEDYITYKYLDQEVYGRDDVHRIKARHFAKHLKDIIDYAHARHIDVFMQVYEFQYPPKLGELYKLDLANPDMKTIIEAKVKELFEVVPLDGLVITATESLPRSGYKSIEPWRKHGKAGAGKMMTMYHNAGKQLGKKVIFRSWMIAYGAEDSDQVIANTPEDAEFEIKHTGDDFWLNFPLTDAIENGLGKKRPLTMTFDVHPQYYGW